MRFAASLAAAALDGILKHLQAVPVPSVTAHDHDIAAWR